MQARPVAFQERVHVLALAILGRRLMAGMALAWQIVIVVLIAGAVIVVTILGRSGRCARNSGRSASGLQI